ncbi:MAG: VCBS repeat-containing protein [Chloroflexales bacterium]|nr:VCBS repeat-containing protein [Chloroflexales bacterium]
MATRIAMAKTATAAAPTVVRPPTATPRTVVISNPEPFRHSLSGLAGLKPAGWSLEGDASGVTLRSARAGQAILTATLTLSTQFPEGGPAEVTSDLFARLKSPGLQVVEETRTPDGGGRLTLGDGPGLTTTIVRAAPTERGLLAVSLTLPTELLPWEDSSARALVDAVKLSGDYLTAVPCNSAMAHRPVTADDSLTLSRGNGAAGFAPAVWYDARSLVVAAGIGDFDGDGRQDVAGVSDTTDGTPNQLYVLLQLPDGGLGEPNCFSLEGMASTLAIGDFNSDGRDDVVVGGQSRELTIFFSAPEGIFGTRRGYPLEGAPGALAVGDLNGDGRDDLVANGFGANQLGVFLQQESGEPGSGVSVPVVDATIGDLALGDVTGDGLPDLVAVTIGRDSIMEVFAQQPDGSFAEVVAYQTSLAARTVAVGDVTGDGRAEVVLNHGNDIFDSWIVVYEQRPTGRLAEQARYPVSIPPTATELADVDGDGRTDVVLVGETVAAVFRQRDDGSLGAEESTFVMGSSSSPQALDVGDLNGDGRNDIVVAGGAFSILYGQKAQR